MSVVRGWPLFGSLLVGMTLSRVVVAFCRIRNGVFC